MDVEPIIANTIKDIRRHVASARSEGKTIALVPTMGALHEGHASLFQAAAACDFVVASIFVNPTQFGPQEDLARYPRSPQADLALCRDNGVHAVFMPETEEMYPPGWLTEVSVGKLDANLCGRSRPGHFTGVATVVAKLFNIVAPDKAFFGAKDYQQTVVIRRMTLGLNYPVEIVVCPTVRHGDGLAVSSRNTYLSAEHRKQATSLWGALEMVASLIRRRRPPTEEVVATIREHLATHAPEGVVDYIQIVDPADLTDVRTTKRAVLVALAVNFGTTRLIDNVLVGP
jgi:pantoate--beta-alanine ligase